ncbi:ribonuclease P protein component [uncultured Bacteroides sp.]|uniref:ribonuclease P protein component n=1 Tax=uncultured Bacteroides sp. TaxID=162156 RepID=UPI002AA7EE3A|nr:ribonuclease P protein component [uncultured Bacteroides sp.]
MGINTLCKSERLSSKISIEKMFAGGAKSFSVFPLRVVFIQIEKREEAADVSILISVSKKRFKRAVDRNRVKRQIREAYRKNKHTLLELQGTKEQNLVIGVIYSSTELVSSAEIEEKLNLLLGRIAEKLA